ncbi:aldehyde reductase ii protein [Rutstroemia sp. NJR-2017a WRK4]|nr:aldehyde reductase ii protein [Rutstroemia sp. NJR-2017a WRK4]
MAPAIPKGSTVLVTGVNGYIGSHVADQLLLAGYRVRGTTREASKAAKLMDIWGKKYGKDLVELAIVPDMAAKGAFNEAMKGVSGVAHVASNMSFSPDPNQVIPDVLAGVNEVLNSAAAEPSVKRFVFTSSSMAATHPKPNEEFFIDENMWNEEDVKAAHAPPPYEPSRAWAVYGASKTEAEQALWKFVKEKNPGFVANAVLPDTNFGKLLYPGQPASTGDFSRQLFKGDNTMIKQLPPQYFIDVQDTARLHVSALTNPDVKNERLFGFAEPFTANDLLRAFRKIRPDANIMDDFHDDNVKDLSKVANERAEELLRSDFGRSGWTSLEESLKMNVEDL